MTTARLDLGLYGISDIKEIIKEEIPVKLKYTRKTDIRVEVKD